METQQTSPGQSENIQKLQEASRGLSSRVEQLSPDIFLTGAVASIAISFLLRVTGRQHDAQFVGQWAPTLLLLGLYTREGGLHRTASQRLEGSKGVESREVH